MSVTGNLDTMPLSDLLHWASSNRRSGTLRVRRGKSEVRFVLKNGRIAGCNSNVPQTLLGQFLLARGKIDQDTLRAALARQDQTGEGLPDILQDMGAIDKDELERSVAAKAEETIFRLFEWPSGQFDFEPVVRSVPHMIKVNINVDEVLLRASRRCDELDRMRAVFNDPGMVLCRTQRRLELDPQRSPMAHRLYELIDGSRTLEEILLTSRASEYPATKFLYELYKRDIICVRDVRRTVPERGTPEATCQLAMELVERGEHEAALDILLTSHRHHPDHSDLNQALAKVEAAYLEKTYQADLPPYKMPIPSVSRDEMKNPEQLTANEAFILDLIRDGAADVQNIVRVSPLHEIDVVRALKGLLDKGLARLKGDACPPSAELPEIQAEEMQPVLGDLGADIEESLDGIMKSVEPR